MDSSAGPPEPQPSSQVPLEELLGYLNALVDAFDSHPDEATREAVFNLLQTIDALHRGAFTRLTAYLNERHAGHLLVDAARADRLIHTVLSLYDLLPDDEAVSQVELALARVRPYIESHGGRLQLLSVEGGAVHLEMGGACLGCQGATYTLQRGIRQALEEHFPALEEIVVHAPAPATAAADINGFITLESIPTPQTLLAGPDFQPVLALDELPAGAARQARVNDVQALLANVDGEIYAVGDFCPGSMLPLSSGELDGVTILCPWHGERYDVRSGFCLDPARRKDRPRLPVYPVAVVDGQVQIAVNVTPRPPLVEVNDGG